VNVEDADHREVVVSASMESKTLKVPGATLYYETVGSGPVLLCSTGGPTDAGMFSDLAGRLAGDFTVVSYDQRGHSRSPLEGEPGDLTVDIHAEDAAALLSAVADQPAYVYGNSGGAAIGLGLVTRHGDQVGTLVAHEAPLMALLPDADTWRSGLDDIAKLYATEGAFAAMGLFGAMVEEGGPKYSEEMQQSQEPPTPEAEAMMQRMMGNFDLFVAHELAPISRYEPDIEALKNAPTRIVSAVGETSEEQRAARAARILAERLGIPATPLPGAHGGWGSHPQEFADRLRTVLLGD
jgi:pimeloyl-ACP methyl ester carboxylesterase